MKNCVKRKIGSSYKLQLCKLRQDDGGRRCLIL
uniref:Uncharacterized protein n=1 Tax=Rhizophora mucronata TaxID=61149 RepID=A0A2P2QE88_RHIMU